MAVLEYAANIDLELMPRALHMTVYEIPEMEFLTFKEKDLPGNWRAMPGPQSTKDFGSIHVKDSNVVGIKVPSIIISEEFNYLINPESNRLSKITKVDASDFIFDIRIKG